MDKEFEGRVAVVTGGAQGIGAATAGWFAHRGASVAVLDIDGSAAGKRAEQLTAEGAKVVGLKCDVSNREAVETVMSAIEEQFGRIDILVNNAGVTRDNLIFRMTDDEWNIVLDTHLKGSFLCSRAVQKYMVKQRYGKIVCVSSRAALGNRGQVNYSAAKAGMQDLVSTLAVELGPFNINVNSVAPGHIDTAMTRGIAERTGVTYDDVKEQAISLNSIKRVGTPDDIAAAIAFLAGDKASSLTGKVFSVTGRH